MQTKQTLAVALTALASMVSCQIIPVDVYAGCNQASPAAVESTHTTDALSSGHVFIPIASASPDLSAREAAAEIITFSYVQPTAPAPSTTSTKKTKATITKAKEAHASTPSANHPASTTKAAPAASPINKAGTPSSGQGLSGACSAEGMFNCVGGTKYQRCAAGKWTALQPAAAKCKEGQSMSLWRRSPEAGSGKGTFQSRRRGE